MHMSIDELTTDMEKVLRNSNLDFLMKSIMFAILTKKAKGNSVTCPEIVKYFEGDHYVEYHVEYDVEYILHKFQDWGLIEIGTSSEIHLKNIDSDCEPSTEEKKEYKKHLSSITKLSSEENKERRKAASEVLKRARVMK